MGNKNTSLLKSYRNNQWEEIEREDKKEFEQEQMKRVGDKVEEYREKERKGREKAVTTFISCYS